MVKKMNEGYEDILMKISSKSPTPGGGAVSALTLAHSYALTSMVANLTINSKKWSGGHMISKEIIENSISAIKKCLSMAQDDCDAFDDVMISYKLPKNNDSDIDFRNKEIQKKSYMAALAPMKIARETEKLYNFIIELAENCNANALTDLASASEIAHSSAFIASLNVKINLSFIPKNKSKDLEEEINQIYEKCKLSNIEVQNIINRRLGW